MISSLLLLSLYNVWKMEEMFKTSLKQREESSHFKDIQNLLLIQAVEIIHWVGIVPEHPPWSKTQENLSLVLSGC